MAEPIEWDDPTFEAALKGVAAEGAIHAAGVSLDADRLARLIDAAPEDPERPGRRRLRADFSRATFTGPADFGDVTFVDPARFAGARFLGAARFGRARFTDMVDFRDGVRFARGAEFDAAVFGGDTWFDGAVFEGDASFRAATFERARELGPVRARDGFLLDETEFAQSVRIEVMASWISCSRTIFRGATDLLAGGDVSLQDADFAQPSLVTGRLYSKPPRVVSVRRAKLAQLTLSGVDLRACRFAGAHGLDRMRLEGVDFERSPTGWRRVGRWWRVRWLPRDTVAEERHWRAWHGYGAGWEHADVRAPEWIGDVRDPSEAATIEGIYRALRKGREDSRDEPGANDFYYGEMEMRRHAGRRRRTIPIVWLYWLVSGYGLRASRALLALAVTILLGWAAFELVGFDPGTHPDDGTPLFAVESSISLLRAPDTENLTAWGHLTQIVLRLAGPLFFALAVVSLRGRVKR